MEAECTDLFFEPQGDVPNPKTVLSAGNGPNGKNSSCGSRTTPGSSGATSWRGRADDLRKRRAL